MLLIGTVILFLAIRMQFVVNSAEEDLVVIQTDLPDIECRQIDKDKLLEVIQSRDYQAQQVANISFGFAITMLSLGLSVLYLSIKVGRKVTSE